MFQGLVDKLSSAFKNFRSKGKLTESDVKTGMREIKLALLDDVEIKDSEGNVKTISGTGVIPIVKNLKIKFNENTIGEIR